MTYELNYPENKFETVHNGLPDDALEESKQQHDALLFLLPSLLPSGVVGSNDKTYRVTMSGHANLNHEPTEGWANDSVTITIYQV